MNDRHLTDSELQEFLDGVTALSSSDRAHLEHCPSCQASLQAYKSVYEQIKSADSRVIADGFSDRIMERVNTVRIPSHRHNRLQSASAVSMTVTLATVALGVVALRIFAPQVLLHVLTYAKTPFQIIDSALGSSTTYVLTEFNLKPEVVLLTLITFGFIATVDRVVIRYRRSKKFLSLLA